MVKSSLCQQPEDMRLDFCARVSGTGTRQHGGGQEASGQILWAELWGVLVCSTITAALSWCHPQPWAKGSLSHQLWDGLWVMPRDAQADQCCPRRLSPAPHMLTEQELGVLLFSCCHRLIREGKIICSPNVLGV